mgnify:CR=1 FL=1
MKADTFRLARDIARGKWLVAYPGTLVPVARAYINRMPVEIEASPAACSFAAYSSGGGKGSGKSAEGSPKVAVIPLHGTMTKYETCESYGTS